MLWRTRFTVCDGMLEQQQQQLEKEKKDKLNYLISIARTNELERRFVSHARASCKSA